MDDAGDAVSEAAGEGTDTVVATTTYTLSDNLENLTLAGTSAINGFGNDLVNTIIGNAVANVIDGGGGADIMMGGAGDDTYYVDDEGDSVVEDPGAGNDTIISIISFSMANMTGVETLILSGDAALDATGNDLDNVLTGNAQANQLFGGGGNDTLDGGGGADSLAGGSGDDIYHVDNPGDIVIELPGEGTDTVYTTVDYTLTDNVERLVLAGLSAINGTGNGLDNIITGNDFASVIDGGGGADTMIGGAGDDTYYVNHAGDVVIEAEGSGNDTILSTITFSLAGHASVENLTLTGSDATDATGNDHDNDLIGNSAQNRLTGGAGNDRLNGGAGADTMIGGLGDDLYIVDNTMDVIVEADNEGADTIISSVGFLLPENVETLILTGSLNLMAIGNDGANTIVGNSGDNIISGGLGRDIMRGGLGNDVYIVDRAADVVVELADAGTDTVRASSNYFLPSNVENLILTGLSVAVGVGNALNNIIVGNDAFNLISGGEGADIMLGGKSNDTYIVDNAGDVVFERAGEGLDTVRSRVSYSLAQNVENLTLTGTESINATGNAGANTLIGNSAANILTGGLGRDVLLGNGGRDIFVYNTVEDSAPLASRRDVITDFVHLTDRLDLSAIDADTTTAGNQAFTLLASRGGAFTGAAGELRYWGNDNNTFVEADVNGDGVADMQIQLMRSMVLTKDDFIL